MCGGGSVRGSGLLKEIEEKNPEAERIVLAEIDKYEQNGLVTPYLPVIHGILFQRKNSLNST